jgi:hypothetical protein
VPGKTPRGFEGENVIHVGKSADSEMFWGRLRNGLHPPDSESGWWETIQDWDGCPEWKNLITYPVVGLQK